MYNPNVPSSNMGIAPISGQPSQPMGPTPMGPPPPMAPPMMGGMPPPPMMAPPPMAPPPMAPPIAPITEGLGGFGGSSAGRAGFSERMQRMTSPPKPKPMPMPMPQPMPVQRMNMGGAVSSQGLSMYQPPMMPRPMANGGSVPRRTEISGQPHMLAYINPEEENLLRGLGGSGQPGPGGVPAYAREDGPGSDNFGTAASNYGYGSSGNSSDSSYEDEAYGDDGYGNVDYGGGPNYGGGDDSGGDDDDYYDYLDDDYVYVSPPAPAPPVVVPEPESGDDDIKDRVVADLVYSSAEPTVGPNNAQEAVEQAVAANKLGNLDLADSSLATLASRISRGRDVMPARLSSVDAISRDFAVPAPEDTTFSDPDEIFNLRNPISLNAAQVVGPNSRTDASGNLIPGRADTKADIEAGTEAALSLGPEVMSSDPSMGSSGVPLSQLPTSIGGMVDKPVVGTAFPPIGARYDVTAGARLNEPEADLTTPIAPKMALPGGSARTSIEDDGLANAMAAAQAGSNEINALGSDAYTGIFEPEFVEPTPAEIQASNRRAMAEARADDASGRRVDVDPDRQAFGTMGLYDGLTIPQSPRAAGSEFAASDAQSLQNTINRLSSGREAPDVLKAAEIENARLISQLEPVLAQPMPTGGGLAGASTRPGMGSDDPIVYNDTPSGTRRNSDGRTVSGIAPSPAPAVINPQNTKYLSPFDISELENLEKDYYRTGAGSSDYDPMAAQATAEALKRAEGDVSALDRIAEARMPTDDMQIVDDMRSVPRSSPEFAAPVGDLAQFEPQVRAASSQPATTAGTDGSGTEVDDVDIFGGNFNRDQFTDREFYKNREDLYSLFGPSRGAEIFNSAVKSLSMGLIDLDKLSAKQREKALEAYLETGKLAYNKDGKLIGVEDPDGRAILLGPQPPKDEDNIGGDDDGCPPGFRRVNGVCMPIQRVAQNPATAISDSINKATLPNTLRPIVRDVVDDEDEEEETSDVGGLTIRRPNYFAGGGAVSEGMGSAIDNFLSSMGGNVKKKSNVAPVNMFLGGLVDRFTGRNDYTDPYEELGRDYGYDPTDPFGDGDTSYGDDGPSDTVTADTFIGPMQPNVTYQPPAAPVDTGGDETDPFVKNAILSARNYYNDGSVGPTMQNASMLPAAPKNVNDITADYVKFIPPNMRNNLMMGKDFSRSLLHAGVDNIGGIVGLGLDDGVTSAGEKFFQTASENPLGTLYNIGLGAAQGVGSALYDPYKAAKTVTDQFISSGKNLMQPVTPETNPDQLLGDISVVGSAFPLFSGVKAAGNLTPKNNTISTNIKPSNETLTFYKGSPVAYDPEPGFPLGRARSAYSGTGEGNRPMGSPEALGEVLGVHSGKAWGAGDYQTQSPSTATGYRFMRSGLDRNLQEAAVKAAQDRVNFVDAGGRPDNFQTIFSEKIDAVDNAAKDASLGVKAAENVYADANRTAAERILDSSIFDTSRFRGDPRREIDPQGFYRSVVFGANDQIDEELYAIRDIISNRGNMDYGDPGYSKRMREINRDFPNLTNLTNKQIAERRAELRDLSKQYTGDVSKKYIDLTQTYRIAQDAEKAKKNLTDFETAVTADLPGVLYKTEIQEGNLGSFLDYDAPIDSQILTQATNALGVDAMNAKLFGTGPDAKKLQYNPKTQQYSFPRKSHNKFTNPDGSPIFANLPTERILAPQTVAEAKLYRDAGITHGQHKTGRKYKKVGDREIPIYNKIFFDDDATPVPVGRYNRGGQVGMGLGSL